MPPDEGTNPLEFFSPDTPASGEAEPNEAHGADTEELDQVAEGDENADAESGDENPEQAEADDEELEEIEHSGKKFKLPKELKPLLMMQQDYTRKTQEVAKERETVQQEQARIKQAETYLQNQAEFYKQITREVGQLQSLDERLAQYQQVDWRTWQNQDYLAADAAWKDWQTLKDQRQQIVATLQQKDIQARQEQQNRAQEAQRVAQTNFAKRREETGRVLQRDIKGWNDEIAGQVAAFAERNGYTRDEVMLTTQDPRHWKMFYQAWRGEQLESQQKAAAQKAKAQLQQRAEPLTPVAKGRAVPATAGLDDRLSPEEWTRRRNEQLRKRRA